MGFLDNTRKFLGVGRAKQIEAELESTREQLEVAKAVLENNKEVKSITNWSSIAQEEKRTEDPQGLKLKRVPVRQLQHLYTSNQFIFRGVNVRADEMVSRGYAVSGGDEKGRIQCEELINISGGDNLFWQFSVNTDVAGDGYLEMVLNKDKNKIAKLKHVNPINFGYMTDDFGKIILNGNNMPKAYMQVFHDKEGVETKKEVPKDRISHLKFNSFADEFNGVSSLQPVYNTTVRLMNMEQAAAEAAVKTANPLLVGKTETKSLRELQSWSSVLNNISSKDQVFLPMGVDLKMLSPGYQNFSYYSTYFLDAVVAALGVPKAILTGSSDMTGGNRSTITVQSRHFYSVIRANQRYVEQVVNRIFAYYGKIGKFIAPTFKFNDIAEDADRNGQRSTELFQAGIVTLEEARFMIGLETDSAVKEELQTPDPSIQAQGIKGAVTDADVKKSDKEAFHPANAAGPAGSQKGNKKKQKIDPEVKSVRQ